MKFCQILVYYMTNIFNMFLAQCWRLDTSSRSFYDFITNTIKQDLVIVNSWYLPFLNNSYSPFKKKKHWNLNHWLLSNWSRLLNWKAPAPILQIVQKIPENYCSCLHLSTGQVWLVNEFGSKDIFTNTPCLIHGYSSWRHRFNKLGDGWKYKNLNILRVKRNFSTK